MEYTTALTLSWLNFVTPKRYDALIEQFGSIDAVLEHLSPKLLAQLGCREETIFAILNRLEEFDVDRYQTELEKRSITFITREDEIYPPLLKQIEDAPVFLYYKGSLDILSQPTIGCVGKREMSTYGKRLVEEFMPAFVRSGMVTVSGLARGIDAEVATQTMAAGGKTVAVLGHGLGNISPIAAKQLADQIVEQGGLILSEFPLDQSADKYTFPARNRIIAGLSLGTVVFEAGQESGALITAELALEYNRDVFAIPGQIFAASAAGCHYLIQSGQAQLASAPEQVLQSIGIIVPEADHSPHQAYEPADKDEAAIYGHLTSMPQSVSDLVEKAQIDAAIINAKLTMLELNGTAQNVGNGMWIRK